MCLRLFRLLGRLYIPQIRITHYEQLQGKVDEVMTEQDRLLSSIKAKEQRIGEIGLLIKHVSAYREHRPVYEQYRKSSDKEKFLRGQESQIILFESAAKALKQMGVQRSISRLILRSPVLIREVFPSRRASAIASLCTCSFGNACS